MNQFAQTVFEKYGRVDVMINNAGVALGQVTAEEVTREDFKWVMDINFWGMINGSQAFLPFIKKQSEGAVANVSSIFGIAGIAHQAAYCTSKFAIRGYTESMRMESKLDFPHVTIHSIHPGGIKTNIVRNSRWTNDDVSEEEREILSKNFESQFITTPEKAASVILKSIQRKKERILIGPDAKLMDRLVRWFPTLYTKIFLWRIKKELLKGVE
jgi:NAD(P)-dependent dehydrogenase (short-subunit alcohol dehydrogenase family)